MKNLPGASNNQAWTILKERTTESEQRLNKNKNKNGDSIGNCITKW
jgi:hypothetical protein